MPSTAALMNSAAAPIKDAGIIEKLQEASKALVEAEEVLATIECQLFGSDPRPASDGRSEPMPPDTALSLARRLSQRAAQLVGYSRTIQQRI